MSLKTLLDLLSAKPLLTRKDLARRYQKETWTIDRWHREGILPKPRYLRGCATPFWRPCDIEAAEKKQPQLKRALNK